MNRKQLKVGDEVAVGRDDSYTHRRLVRAIVVDIRSWIRVYDKEEGRAVDMLRDDFVKEKTTRYASSKYGWRATVPQSGILVRVHDHDDVWSEPRIVYTREIPRFWAQEEARQAEFNEAEELRRERVRQMHEWLRDLGVVNYDTYKLDREVRLTYEQIEKLHDDFGEARLSG